jgi:hypothetical protein
MKIHSILLFIAFSTSVINAHTFAEQFNGYSSIKNTYNNSNTFTCLDYNRLLSVKSRLKESKFALPYEKLIKRANQLLVVTPFTVVSKTQIPPSGDKHDYISLAPYWWPDPSKPDGLPWIRKDGEVNPLTKGKNTDDDVKDDFIEALEKLSLAYFFSDNDAYAQKSITLLKAWFINPETKMNPNLNFGQGIPGVNTGREFGIIEFKEIVRIITAIEILENTKKLDVVSSKSLRQWMTDYLFWLENDKMAVLEKTKVNNHGTWYDVQEVALLIFLNKKQEAKKVLETIKNNRIAVQIEADGKQTDELTRTKALSYSTMNLNAFTNLAYFGKKLGIDLWNFKSKTGGSIQQAYQFLKPYAFDSKKWDYKQIEGLDEPIKKLQYLFLKSGSLLNHKAFCVLFENKNLDKDLIDILLYPCMN